MTKIILKITAVFLTLYTIAGFFLVPYIVQHKGVAVANEKLNGTLSLQSVRFNPFTFEIGLHDVAIVSQKRKKIISFDDLVLTLKPFALFDNSLHVSALKLEKPFIDVIYSKDKKINLLSLLKPQKEEPKSKDSKPMRFMLDALQIDNGGIKYEDLTKSEPYILSLENFQVKIKNIDTKPKDPTNTASVLRFDVSEGGHFEIINDSHSLNPLKTDGKIEISSLVLYPEWKYFKDMLHVEVADGKLDAHIEYHLDLDKLSDFKIEKTSLHVRDFRLKPSTKPHDILDIKDFEIAGIMALPLKQEAYIDSVTLKGIDLRAQRDAKGFIDWQEYAKVNQTATKQKESNTTKKWKFRLDRFVLDDSKIAFSDAGVSPVQNMQFDDFSLHVNNIDPEKSLDYDFHTDFNHETKLAAKGKLTLDPLNQEGELSISALDFKHLNPYIAKLTKPALVSGKLNIKLQESVSKTASTQNPWKFLVKNFDLNSTTLKIDDTSMKPSQELKLDNLSLHVSDLGSDPASWFSYQLSTKINNNASLNSNGKLQRQPLRQEGEFTLQNLDLPFVNPYIDPITYAKIKSGVLSISGSEKYDSTASSAKLDVNGKFALNRFLLSDTRDAKTLTSLEKLEFGYTFDLSPNRLYIDKLFIDSLYANTVIEKDKTINFAKLLKPTKPQVQTAQTKAVATKKEQFAIKIDEINIKNSTADFADTTPLFLFKTHIHDLNGKVYGISSEPNEMSNVDLNGVVDKYGSAKIKGSLNAADPKKYTDIKMKFENLAMSNLSAYSATFAGYKIDDGKLFIKLGYKIDDGKLDSTNNVIIKRIKLGETIKDANVTVWPLRFAVALLEDNNGVIDIDLPIQGDLNNPDFRYGAMVWKVLGNLVTKAVTAPFKLLGSMFGFSADSVEAIEFDAGKSQLSPPELEKLDKITIALTKRSQLNLSITPSFNVNEDRQMMQRAKLMAQISQKSKDINDVEKRNALHVELLEKIFLQNSTADKLGLIKSKFKEEYKDVRKFNEKYALRLMKEDSVFMSVSEEEIRALAVARGKSVVQYMVEKQHIEPSRIVVEAPKEDSDAKDRVVKTKLDIVVK
jgi:hypothetical protein